MIKRIGIIGILAVVFLLSAQNAYALSSRHHLINSGKNIVKAVLSPVKGIFITGPSNIKKTWQYEVHQREKPEDRNTAKSRLFAIWRAPGDEIKGIIEGAVGSAEHLGKAMWEMVSVVWGD